MEYIADKSPDEIFAVFNRLNEHASHFTSTDDICTDMACVKKMLDYVPDEFWEGERDILDPCCGNGNFGAYAAIKSPGSRIYFNEPNPVRRRNCAELLRPERLEGRDFFEITDTWDMKWDLIMANPPYSGGANKNRNLFVRFLDHSIDLLNDGGYLCYVVPNSWMTYNNRNTLLHRLLTEGSFLVLDNDVKKHFPGVGSSFVILVWQKGVHDNKTTIRNAYLRKDVQEGVVFPPTLPFIPLYVSNEVVALVEAVVDVENISCWKYRCDLHNHTQRQFLSDERSDAFPYETIHTARKTRWASKKQDVYDKWLVITPLSTYFEPYIRHNVNVTQSVGYIACDTKREAEAVLADITRDPFVVLIHLTRYGNFNCIMLLKHLRFGQNIELPAAVEQAVAELRKLVKY